MPPGQEQGLQGMGFDFDRIIDRRGTHCSKWDGFGARFSSAPEDALPMWVADMDFAAAPAVTAALRAAVDHGVYGYFGDPGAYNAAICGWMKRRHGWDIEDSWIISTAGVVNGVYQAIQAFCRPGDGVVIQEPIYHPFAPGIRNNGCHIVSNPLRHENGRYSMDLDQLASAVDAKTRMMLLCSPHNPTGRVWTREELQAIGEFCLERDIILISDEVHHDLVFDGPHTVMATLGEDIAQNLIMFTSASKTFNLAGGHLGQAIIPNPRLRRQYRRQAERNGLLTHNRFGFFMTEAAYRGGEDWLEALLTYLRGNRDHIDRRVASDLKGVRSVKVDATYLGWLDLTGLGMEHAEIVERFEKRARVFCNHGPSFGVGGDGFMRINFATQRARVDEAMDRLAEAFSDLQ